MATTAAVAVILAACGGGAGGGPTSAGTVPALSGTEQEAVGAEGATVLAAGDVADCAGQGDEQTAALLDRLPGVVLVLGDAAYPDGTAEQFARCYGPGWGRHVDRTRPAPGNHEYESPGAQGYFRYFGPRAGEPGRGWYSFDLGGWHLVALNSNCTRVGGCDSGSEQERWLRADLARHRRQCTLAYWHHPRFSSGSRHGNGPQVNGLWRTLHDAGADVVLSGHEHNYERFAPLDGDGRPVPSGMRQFVVGTGGKSRYPFGPPLPGSEARDDTSFGVLKLTLRSTDYEWTFEAVDGQRFTDGGSGRCR